MTTAPHFHGSPTAHLNPLPSTIRRGRQEDTGSDAEIASMLLLLTYHYLTLTEQRQNETASRDDLPWSIRPCLPVGLVNRKLSFAARHDAWRTARTAKV